MRRAGRWPWPLETVSLHDPRAAPLPAAGGPAAFPFGRSRGRGESGTFPVEGTQGIGILPFGNAVYWRGEQTPSQLQVLPRTPCRRPAGTQRTPQISADTPQIPDRDPRTPCGHPTETRRHPTGDLQAPRGRRGCSCRQPSGRPSRATQGDGLCRPLLSLPDQLGKRVRPLGA